MMKIIVIQDENIIILGLLMGKKKFNKKQSVRYTLVPSKDEQGNPMNLFKPVETNSRLTHTQKKELARGLEDYEIEIDGKRITSDSEIPAYILEQIKGRADLVYNHKHPEMMEEEEGLIDEEDEEGLIFEEEEEWEDEEDERESKKQQEEKQEFVHEGVTYNLTKKQIEMLEQVMPENYEQYIIEGVQFAKYDDDGNKLDKKMEFKKYLAEPEEKRVVVDSYQFVPEKPLVIFDNDLKEDEIKGEMKQIEDALNYEGDDQAYEEIEDDFFAKLLQPSNQQKDKEKQKKATQSDATFKKKKGGIEFVNEPKKEQKQIKNPVANKWDDIDEDQADYDDEDYEEQILQEGEQEITDEMVDQAIEEFDKLADMEEQGGEGLTGLSLINFIESREECIGRDGELDWRTLTKKEKKEYMKNKKIRSFLQELRERQIAQKMKGIKNVDPNSLHLKQYVEKLPYKDDHVIQEAIERDAAEQVDLDKSDSEDFETDSEEDDIISYRAKTSIISSNLATVEEVGKKKKKQRVQKESQVSEGSKMSNIQKIKIVPQKRNKNESKEERKARKEKLKEMKKSKKEQKKQFSQLFEGERKKVIKNNSHHKDALHKVSYVKIA